MVRVWSSTATPAGRMPGVTVRKSEPCAALTAPASCAEQTTPFRPLSAASAVRRATCAHFAPAAGVNVHHPHAHVGGDAQGGGDGVGNVVKFEVKEDVVANALQGFDQRPALARVQFFADFDAAQFGRELRRQHERVLAAIDIKRDEQRFVFHRFSTLSSSIGRKLLQAKQAGQCQMRFCWRKPHSLHWYTVRGAISLPAVLASGAKFVRYVR